MVRSWTGELTDDQIAGDPRLALVVAGCAFSRGDLPTLERWEATASRRLNGDADTDVVAVARLARSVGATDGLAALASTAGAARGDLAEDGPWYSTACFLEGAALHLMGNSDRADAVLGEGARRGALVAPAPHALCLAELAMVAFARDDLQGAAQAAGRARRVVDHYGLARYATSALVFAVSAGARARSGRVDEAQEDARQALGLLERLSDFAPWFLAQTQLTLSGTFLRLSDPATARALIDDARAAARRLDESDLLHAWITALDDEAGAASAALLPTRVSLTTAELRILRFLPTHLSLREIGERLYVSANTVKTQAHAVYRKLGASSRSQAVARAAELGLLDV
jgi:LuxR family maltose regulon positive regulatory protein